MRLIAACLLTICPCLARQVLAEPPSAPEPLEAPGILLTFDDTYVAQWVAAMPLFEKYGARVTFFVSRFDTLTEEQVAGLKKLEAAGHAIGCHGLRHIKGAEYTEANGVDDYLKVEILPAMAAMKEAGFTPVSFAYPSSNNNATTDEALLKIFRHLRTGTGAKPGERYADMDVLFTPLGEVAGRGCLTGKGIDRIGGTGNEDRLHQLFEAMERAATQRECLTLYAHGIAESGKHHHITPATLERVLAHAQSLGLRFYTFDELP